MGLFSGSGIFGSGIGPDFLTTNGGDGGWNGLMEKKSTEDFNNIVASITNDSTIDQYTKNELLALSKKGKSQLTALQSAYGSATKNEGVYAVRKLAEERNRQIADQPGRKQTFLLGGGNSTNGGAGTTFLTGK